MGIDGQLACASRVHCVLPNNGHLKATVEDRVVEDVEQHFGQCHLADFEIVLPVGERQWMAHIERNRRAERTNESVELWMPLQARHTALVTSAVGGQLLFVG